MHKITLKLTSVSLKRKVYLALLTRQDILSAMYNSDKKMYCIRKETNTLLNTFSSDLFVKTAALTLLTFLDDPRETILRNLQEEITPEIYLNSTVWTLVVRRLLCYIRKPVSKSACLSISKATSLVLYVKDYMLLAEAMEIIDRNKTETLFQTEVDHQKVAQYSYLLTPFEHL